ncbi:MAG: sialidase family protein [Clostridia bacterium]
MFSIFNKKKFYDMNIVDLSPENSKQNCKDDKLAYMFNNITVDYPVARGENRLTFYLGHPDSVLLDSGKIIVAYPLGHGKGETALKESVDGGITWSERFKHTPESFKNTIETPTIYKLDFNNGTQKLVMISGRPAWLNRGSGNGFDVTYSVSKDASGKCDGKVWAEHENFYGSNAKRKEFFAPTGKWETVVAMASLTKLKENGEFVDKWMGIFHLQYPFKVHKTILSFDSHGNMIWSEPTLLLPPEYHTEENKLQFCEPEVVRSPKGDELAVLFRTNGKASYSQVCFSKDEGKTWSKPQNLSRELTGERHKAEYDPVTGKLIVTFRSIDWYLGKECKKSNWFSRGWLAWVGDYDNLHKGLEGKGDFVIKLAHIYDRNQEAPQIEAHADTGYAGLTIDSKGNVVTMSYGKFKPKCNDTFIVAKRFTIKDIQKLIAKK